MRAFFNLTWSQAAAQLSVGCCIWPESARSRSDLGGAELMLPGLWCRCRADGWLECHLGCAGSDAWSWPGSVWSGWAREGAQAGEDLGKQAVAGWEAQAEAAGVADHAGGMARSL